MSEVHGSHEGRGERNRVTRNWLNATQLNDIEQPIEQPLQDTPNYTAIDTHVGTIRHLLHSGIKHIIVTEHDEEVRKSVWARLTPEEKATVVFSPQTDVAGVVAYDNNMQLVEHVPVVAGDDDFSLFN